MEIIGRRRSYPPINIRTKCTNMTDEGSLLNGNAENITANIIQHESINSTGQSNAVYISDSISTTVQYNDRTSINENSNKYSDISNLLSKNSSGHFPNPRVGGRLQFFKDGKFILELARSKEGEKAGWVSVPRKTFWPPSLPSTNPANCTKNESSTSLSFSDDNSSIQSSPWQRDHCWKQTTPRRDISKEMCMYYKRKNDRKLSKEGKNIAKIKKRKPYDKTMCKDPFILRTNGFNNINKNELDFENKIKISNEISDSENDKINIHENINKLEFKKKPKAKLNEIFQKLIDRLPITNSLLISKTISGNGNQISNIPTRVTELHQQQQQHISPRKRILREFEKVSLDDVNNKRSRAKNNTNTIPLTTLLKKSQLGAGTPILTKTSQNITYSSNDNNINSVSNNCDTVPASTRLYSSYSIHSLLGNTSSNNIQKNEFNSKNNNSTNLNNSTTYLVGSPRNHYDSSSNNINWNDNTVMNLGRHKSPSNLITMDTTCQNSNKLNDSPVNFTKSCIIDSQLNHDLNNRNKLQQNYSSGFYPYKTSPKHSTLVSIPNINENFNKIVTSTCSTRFSPINNKSPISSYQQINKNYTTNSQSIINNCIGESTSIDKTIQNIDIRGDIIRNVPKKTTSIRQNYLSPISSPNINTSDSPTLYKYNNEQKRKISEDITASLDNKIYQSNVDFEHAVNGILRSSLVIPPSTLYYLYPPHGRPAHHNSSSPSSYLPSLSYYQQISSYAAAVAALRNPIWMHYQGSINNTNDNPIRVPASYYPYGTLNGDIPLQSDITPMHLHSNVFNSDTNIFNENASTENPISLVVKDESSSDAPLNLSKH